MDPAKHTDVFLITGFLGSGKTTFLNRIIRAFGADRKLMILMNEFGEVGVDGRLVEDRDSDMLEISKGSIFCVCVKTDFIKGLSKIANSVRPDILLIEATGVANPADLRKDLKISIFKDRFRFKEQFCIIDALNFQDAYETFTSVEKQIESSTVFIINKTDLASKADINRIQKTVRRLHPDPQFFATTFADIPIARFLSLDDPVVAAGRGASDMISDEQVEAAVDALLDDPAGSMTPPDILMSSVYLWHGKDLEAFCQWASTLPPDLVRAKGFLRENDEIYLFSWVMGKWELRVVSLSRDAPDLYNRIVFIAHPHAMEQLARVADNNPMLSHFSTFDPMAAGA